MRVPAVSVRQSPSFVVLLVGLVVAACLGAGLLWATRTLEGKWLVALLVGLGLLWAALLSGRFERFLLGLLIFFIPIKADVHWHGMVVPFGAQEPNLSAIDLILACLYPVWIIRLLSDRQARRQLWPPGATPLLGLLAWSALSMVNAPDPRLSLLLLLNLVKGFLCYLYLANHVKTHQDLWLVVRCLIAGLLIEGVFACAQYLAGTTFGLEALGESEQLYEVQLGVSTAYRIVGTFAHPNALGRYFDGVLPLALALTMAPLGPLGRLVSAGGFVLGVVALVLTLSRSAWLTSTLACLLLVGWMLRRRHQHRRIIPLLTLVIAGGLLLTAFNSLIIARWVESDRGSITSRFEMNQVAWAIIKSHPILGVGLNHYTAVMHLYDPTPGGIASRYPHAVHNMFLLLAAEVGVMGLVWLGAFLWIVLRRLRRKLAVTDDELTRMSLVGIALGLVAELMNGLMNPIYLSRDMFFWIYPAILVAVNPQHEARHEHS